MKAVNLGYEQGAFNFVDRESAHGSETPTIDGLEYNKTPAGANGCHINFWVDSHSYFLPSQRNEIIKRAYIKATRLFDVVSYGYSLYVNLTKDKKRGIK